MWTAKYINIDSGGLGVEIKVTVLFYNDYDSVTYEKEYSILPEELDNGFGNIIQNQIDILNNKKIKVENIQTNVATPIFKP